MEFRKYLLAERRQFAGGARRARRVHRQLGFKVTPLATGAGLCSLSPAPENTISRLSPIGGGHVNGLLIRDEEFTDSFGEISRIALTC